MFKSMIVGAAAVAALSLTGAPAGATVVTYNVNEVFNGVRSEGTSPIITLQFDDVVQPGAVRMTASAPGLVPTEWVAQLNLNLDPAINSSALTFTNFQLLSGTMLQPILSAGNDTLEAGGGGLFDLQLNFAVSGGGLTRRWNGGEAFSFDIAGAPGLTANSFDFLSTPPAPNGAQPLALLIQGIGLGQAEGWHTVPEPASASLALLGALALRRRARRN